MSRFRLHKSSFLVLGILLLLLVSPAFAATLINSTFVNDNTFDGVGGIGFTANNAVLYSNGGAVFHTNPGFTSIPGRYSIAINGSSDGNNAASIDIQVAGINVGRVTWTSATALVKSVTFDVSSGSSSRQVSFLLTTDSGISNTILYNYALYYEGVIPPPRPAPNLPSQGAALTGNYRNLFSEWGRSSAEIQAKLIAAYSGLFGGGANTVYYTTDSNMAFILDTGNNDIRSEGMSYGMMIAVQMNDQDRFNRLWRFAKTYSQCPNVNFDCETVGMRDGYFSWELSPTAPFTPQDRNPAPDGEEYIATALLFAAGRWGNGTGILNYQQEAQIILDAMLRDNRPNSFRSLFNLTNYLIVFSPNNQSATITDPSYHLPAFYEVWARYDSNPANRTFWNNAAIASRNYWTTVIGSRTNGLMPDCTSFAGAPIPNCAGGTIFAYDAWRTISNVAVDYAWWVGDPTGSAPINAQVTWSNQLQTFFGTRRPSYQNRWNLDGTPVGSDFNSPGHVTMNAVAGLAGNTTRVWDFIEDVWNIPVPTGQYRYYDGMLYMMGLLHLSGNFRVFAPGAPITPPPVATATPTLTIVPGGATATNTVAPTSTTLPSGATATNTVAPTSTTVPSGGGSAYSRIEAESFNGQSGVTTQTTGDSAGGGQDASLDMGSSYLVFNNINFGTSGPASVQIRASTTLSGVNVIFRTGSQTGTPFCTVYPASGGTYQTGSNTCYPSPTGTQIVYVTVTGGPVKLNWLQFVANGGAAPTATLAPTLTFTNVIPPTATLVPTLTSTSVIPPTATLVPTLTFTNVIPPTATLVPTLTFTNVIPPTATFVPTLTATSVIPPTATNTQISAPTATTAAGTSAYSLIESESFAGQLGIVTQSTGDSTGNQDVVLNDATAYVFYNSIDFGTAGPASVQIRASTTLSGVNVVFRTGSATGPAFCTLYPASDGSYQTTSNSCYPRPTGVQTLYITVTGGPVTLNWLQFNP